MDRLANLLIAVVGVPLVLTGYIVLCEQLLRAVPRGWRGSIRPWLWIGPALAMVTTFLVYPTIGTILYSLRNATGDEFVGLANYATIFSGEAFLIAVRNNVLWVVLFTGLVLVLGLLIAILADRVRYESVAKSLIFLPMAVSFVAAGVIWRFMYAYQPPGAPQTGTVNAILTTLGTDPHPFIIEPPGNNFALIVAAVWVWTGFAMVVLSAALKGIPAEILEAARVDGAGELRIFGSMIFPLLTPTLAVIGTTLVIFALKAFDIVYVMTSGNYDTNVLALFMYQQLFNARDLGRASAVAVILLAAVIPVLVVNVSRFRFQESVR
jgi:alpha-glucoside transport system permease protein